MKFEDVKVEDALWARPLLEAQETKSCEYTFVNIYMWKRVYNTGIARVDDFVVARSALIRLHYLWPAGKGDVKKVVDSILRAAEEVGRERGLFSVTQQETEDLEDV